MIGFTNLFSGQPVKSAQVQYEDLTFAQNVTLAWPTESTPGANYVAGWMNAVASAGGLTLLMPDASQGTPGVAGILTNTGAHTFSVLTNTGVPIIGALAAGESWIIVLDDNSTQSGGWQAAQLGALTSNAQASALAGAGLQAILTQLQSYIATVETSANQTITSVYRAKGVVWTGAIGTFQLDAIANVTPGWWFMVTNLGTGNITISTTGSDTINGEANIVIPSNAGALPYSIMIVAGADGFITFGGSASPIPISQGGTGATTSGQALINLGGTSLGINIFKSANAQAVLALLGILPAAFSEGTVAMDQGLTADSANTAYVCTNNLTLSLPDTTDLEKTYLFAVYAQGGDVTLAPVSTDAINGGTTGASYVVKQNCSAMVVTDADGNWWLFFTGYPGIPATTAGGTADVLTATFTPKLLELLDGQTISVRAVAANTVEDPTLKVEVFPTYTITKDGGQPLNPKDIAGDGFEALLRYNEAHTRWELMNPATPWLDSIATARGSTVFRGVDIWEGLAPGTNGQYLTMFVDDTDPTIKYPMWVTRVVRWYRTVLSSNGSFTFPDEITTATPFRIYGVGGGGGSGSSSGGGNGNGTGGGGAGGYADVTIHGFTPSSTATITIGTGGAGGSGGGDGSNGTATIFSYASLPVISFGGGVGGKGGGSGGPYDGGAAGTVSLTVTGLTLESSITQASGAGAQGGYLGNSIAIGGCGGSNPLGQGGPQLLGFSGKQDGIAGLGYGAGGGGGAENGGTSFSGGTGTPGLLVIEWVL
jgi:hypothetical protein